MNKIYLSILLGIVSTLSLSAQDGVRIYTDKPHKSSALEILSDSKGILIPRMTTEAKMKIDSPAEGLLVYDTDQKCVSMYTILEETKALGWSCLTSVIDGFFYMPSINIKTTELGTGLKLDLYGQYQSQFTSFTGKAAQMSPSAPAIDLYTANQLYYYVTYYDPTKIEITSISDTGVMTYNVVGHANYDTYMNVVFVVK